METKDKTKHNENKFSLLLSLIKKESIEEVKEVLQKWSYLLNLKDKSGRSALHYCSEHSSALCADLILERCPAHLSAQDNEGYTVLHLSVISGNQIMTRYLIGKSDANYLNICDNESHTAIHWATVCGELECLDLLLSSGANPSIQDQNGAHPIHYSAQMCSPHSGICIGNDSRIGRSVLQRLLQCSDVDVNCVDADGRSPLLWAASAELRVSKTNYSSGSGDALLALINAGANVSSKDKDGLTALHCASSRGHTDCVETLLTLCGADINQMDSNGCPPLFYAVTLGHADCTRLLIDSGADVNVQDFKGRTAAHCGAARGQLETIKILGQQGANLWIRNIRGDLPLHEAIKSGRKELVKWLLDQIPAAVNATNSFGRSALHIAAINNNIEMCKILIDIGADVNTVMKLKGHFITPLDAALQKGYRGVAKFLLLHGALPAARISQSLNKTIIQRCPSGQRQIDSFATYHENNSPIDSLDEWKVGTDGSNSVLQSQSKPMDSSRTQLPKLPTLVSHNDQMAETSSSTPSSLIENGNHYKNVFETRREFETPLNDKPTNLKQAIITNVYVTNTPICHSKRVPPLKKIKKKRKLLTENEDSKAIRVYTPSMSSSSSVFNGEDNSVRVVVETKDNSKFKITDSTNDRLISNKNINNYLGSENNKIVAQNENKDNFHELASNQIDLIDDNNKIQELIKEEPEERKDENVLRNEIVSDVSETQTNELNVNSMPAMEQIKTIENKTTINENKVSNEVVVNNQEFVDKNLTKSSAKSDKTSEKNESKEKSKEEKKTNNSESEKSSTVETKSTKVVKKEEPIQQKSANNISNNSVVKREVAEKSKKSAETAETASDSEKQENKNKSKVKAKENFSAKLNKLRENIAETDQISHKSEEVSDSSSKIKSDKKDEKIASKVGQRGESGDKSKKSAENTIKGEKQEIKNKSKVKAREEFSAKMTKLREKTAETDKISQKSQEVSDSSSKIRSDKKDENTSSKVRPKKEVAEKSEKSKKSAETASDSEKQENKNVSKVKSREKFSAKLNKLRENTAETDQISHKSEEVSDSSSKTKNDKKDENTSSKVRPKREVVGKSKKSAETASDSEKQENKNKSKVKAREKFSAKLNKLSENTAETDQISHKPKETRDLSSKTKNDKKETIETNEKIKAIEDNSKSDDKKDVDSKTYIKPDSDNESVRSEMCLVKEVTSNGKQISEVKTETEKQKSDDNSEVKTKPNGYLKMSSKKSSENEATNENGEYDEYFDQWESDSEKTVIDSENKEYLTQDYNNNSIEQINSESDDTFNKTVIESKPQSNAKPRRRGSTINVLEVKRLGKVQSKGNFIEEESSDSKSETKSLNKNTTKKEKPIKTEKQIKLEKPINTKSLKPDNKKLEKKIATTNDNSKLEIDKKLIKTQKPINTNIKQTNNKTSDNPKTKPIAKERDKELIKTNGLLESTSHLSASDISLNKSSNNKTNIKSNSMKTSTSNLEISRFDAEAENQNLVNFSSEESIYDSALLLEEMDRSDSEMYSIIDKINTKSDALSPLEHIERNSYSPNREYTDICTEYCNTTSMPHSISRCGHKLHFKTMPANVGRVAVGHIGSRVDSRRDDRYVRSKKVRKVRHNSDGYKSIDPNIIGQTIEKSLRKYQLERKLFEELHDLKRFQIRSGKSNEILMVKRLVDKFRKDVKAPGMTDFEGTYSYKNYEYYLYDQLRLLSTSNQGKVALLTRSSSHENIQLIRNSNENITQSNPEIVPNIEALGGDPREHTIRETQSTDDIHKLNDQIALQLVQTSVNQLLSEKADKEVAERIAVPDSNQSVEIESSCQIDFGNTDREINLNFHIESDRDYTNFDRKTGLDQTVCDSDTEPALTSTAATTYSQTFHSIHTNQTNQTNEDIISENYQMIEEFSNVILQEAIELSKQQIQSTECQSIATNITTNDTIESNIDRETQFDVILSDVKSNILIDRKEVIESDVTNELIDIKTEQTLDLESNYTEIHRFSEQIDSKESELVLDESEFNKQSKVQKTKTQLRKNSSDSQTNQISETKSTIGSKSERMGNRSTYSSVSRKYSSNTTKSKNNSKIKQSFKKECLKPVIALEPSERAKNRPKFKRIKMKIPPKLELNVSADEIRSRWKDIKDSEIKKVYILNAHKPSDELSNGYTLWFELNKSFRDSFKKFSLIDSQMDRHITQYRHTLQRTQSDSMLNQYKLEFNYKPIK